MDESAAATLLDRVRRASGLPSEDSSLLSELHAHISAAAGGTLVAAMREAYASYEAGRPIRPSLSNEMQFLYMRGRQTFTFLLFPELIAVAYHVGRTIGATFDAPRREGLSLAAALTSAIGVAEQHGYGRQQVVEVRGESFARYRTEECADCYGLPNLGLRLCAYEAGVAAGALETVLGRPISVVETRCCAAGDPYDEFEIHAAAPG